MTRNKVLLLIGAFVLGFLSVKFGADAFWENLVRHLVR